MDNKISEEKLYEEKHRLWLQRNELNKRIEELEALEEADGFVKVKIKINNVESRYCGRYCKYRKVVDLPMDCMTQGRCSLFGVELALAGCDCERCSDCFSSRCS